MIADVFVDTNVLVYAVDASEPVKQAVAKRWLDYLWRWRRGRLSVQVLSEYYQIVTRKLRPGLDPNQARRDVRNFLAWHPASVDGVTLEAAWALQDRFELSWWDALIVAAAQREGCTLLLTEDLQDGMRFGDLTVADPFRHSPEDGLLVHEG